MVRIPDQLYHAFYDAPRASRCAGWAETKALLVAALGSAAFSRAFEQRSLRRAPYLSQLQAGLGNAVLGNAGTLIAFRLAAGDAATIARELAPVFAGPDLINLPNRSCYIRLLIDGQPSTPFSATTMSIE